MVTHVPRISLQLDASRAPKMSTSGPTEAPDMSTDLSIGGLIAPDLSTGGSKGP